MCICLIKISVLLFGSDRSAFFQLELTEEELKGSEELPSFAKWTDSYFLHLKINYNKRASLQHLKACNNVLLPKCLINCSHCSAIDLYKSTTDMMTCIWSEVFPNCHWHRVPSPSSYSSAVLWHFSRKNLEALNLFSDYYIACVEQQNLYWTELQRLHRCVGPKMRFSSLVSRKDF